MQAVDMEHCIRTQHPETPCYKKCSRRQTLQIEHGWGVLLPKAPNCGPKPPNLCAKSYRCNHTTGSKTATGNQTPV